MYTFGGSHGGYIQTNLIEDRAMSDLIKCAVIRNPVVYIPYMIYSTDITDWAFGTFLGYKKNLQSAVKFNYIDN